MCVLASSINLQCCTSLAAGRGALSSGTVRAALLRRLRYSKTTALNLQTHQSATLHNLSRVAAAQPSSGTTSFFSRSSTERPKMTQNVRDTITLTPQEQELFQTLLAAVKHANCGTVLRCAGGWVRDKLLGKESADIDIALDNMLGKQFADLVNQYLIAQGKEVHKAAVIHANPDQSKHLETARMKINNLWIDLVNLRSETYAADSRIPEMQFGTPEQDAMRRDFTINSLFYNINQDCVEDLTGRGLQDLRDGLMRTPLPPQQTFLDDPLRVLRAVRFGTRFGFPLDADILEAAAAPEVRTALGQKVSKERVGTELDGMFGGRSPVESVQLLQQLSLFPIVFALPPEKTRLLGEDFGASCVQCMAAADNLSQAAGLQLETEERRFLLLAALLLPLRSCTAAVGPKGKQAPVSSFVVRESIKWRAKDSDMTMLLHDMAPTLLDLYHQLRAGGDVSAAPDTVKVSLGNCIRKMKQHWRLGMLLAPIVATKHAAPLGVDAAAAQAHSQSPAKSSGDEAIQSQEIYGTLSAAVEAFGLTECWQWKPLIDGKQAMALLGLQKAGPELGKALAAAMDWQLCHPSGTQEEFVAFLKSQMQAAN